MTRPSLMVVAGASCPRPLNVLNHFNCHLRLLPLLLASLVLLLSVAVGPIHASQSSITLSNNEYKGLVVGFSQDIPEDSRQRETLVRGLQSLIEGASDLLYKASEQRAFFKEVTFLIPKSWDLTQWSLDVGGLKKTRTLQLSEADLVVKSQGEAFSTNPFTIQYGACGAPGLQIQLSQRWLTDAAAGGGGSLDERSKDLLRQWTFYRYGTFAENGFPGDKLYPLYRSPPGSSEQGKERITSCAATNHGPEPLRTTNLTRSGAICSLETDPLTGLPAKGSQDCIPFPDQDGGNDAIISSLMSHNLPSVKYFCDSKWHDVDAPNKQNALCEEASVWEVIFRHLDFQNGRNLASRRSEAIKTEFRFLQEADTRVGLIVDASRRTLKKALTNTVGRFISKLEADSQILLLDMADKSRAAPSYRWIPKSSSTSNPVIWGREDHEAPMNLKSMVDLFLAQLAQSTPADEELSSELIIVTAGAMEDNANDVNSMAASMRAKNIALRVVVWPYASKRTGHEGEDDSIGPLRELVSKTGGTIHFVARDEDPDEWRVGSHLGLISAFDALPDDSHAFRHVLIARQEFRGSSSVNFEFKVDQTLLKSGITLVAGFVAKDLENMSPKYTLKSPQKLLTTKSHNIYKSDLGRFEVPLGDASMDALAGDWTLHYESDKDETLVGLAYAVVPRKAKPITGRCWLGPRSPATSSSGADGGDHGRQPLALYVSLSQDLNKLVQKAAVEVTLTDDSGRPLNNTPPLRMSDEGSQADITAGDGIYSQHLLAFPRPGFYGAKVKVRGADWQTRLHNGLRASDNHVQKRKSLTSCCGSFVPDSSEPPTYLQHFERTLDCGFFYVDRRLEASDYISRITDLRINSVDVQDRTIKVAWTGPQAGEAHDYEFKVFTRRERPDIRSSFNDRGQAAEQITLSSSGSFGERQATLNVTLPEEGVFYLAMVTARGDRRLAKISNVLNFFMSADPNRVTTTTTEDDNANYSTDHSRSGFSAAGLQTWHIVAIAATSLIVVVLCVACLICLCGGRKNKGDKDTESLNYSGSKKNGKNYKNSMDNGLSNTTIQTTMGASNSNLVSEKAGNLGGHHNISSAISERNMNTMAELNATISPVQSWPAEFLLDHYEKVQVARERNESVPVIRAEDIHVASSQSRSCSTNSNPSQETGSYDDEAYHQAMVAQQRDWRYENLVHTHPAVPYHSSQLGNSMYGEQYAYEPSTMVPPNMQHQLQPLQGQQLSQVDMSWGGPRDSYVGSVGLGLARAETPQSDYNASTAAAQSHYNVVPRRTNAVSQV